MSYSIIHVHPVTHREFKRACRERRIQMKKQIDLLIWNWIRDLAAPKKKLKTLEQSDNGNPFAAPAFWEKTDG
jgi:hypothetical protein